MLLSFIADPQISVQLTLDLYLELTTFPEENVKDTKYINLVLPKVKKLYINLPSSTNNVSESDNVQVPEGHSILLAQLTAVLPKVNKYKCNGYGETGSTPSRKNWEFEINFWPDANPEIVDISWHWAIVGVENKYWHM